MYHGILVSMCSKCVTVAFMGEVGDHRKSRERAEREHRETTERAQRDHRETTERPLLLRPLLLRPQQWVPPLLLRSLPRVLQIM